jgi:sugar phosphate isomerase/epimerase
MMHRRRFLQSGVLLTGWAGWKAAKSRLVWGADSHCRDGLSEANTQAQTPPKNAGLAPGTPTRFQIACMTLPYARFPLVRALKGIQAAGYKYVAWGTTHREDNGQNIPVLAKDDPPAKAKELAARCRDLGLEPVLMFSMIYPEAPDGLEVLTHRIKQAGAAGIGQVLTFGHTKGNHRQLWVDRFKALAPIAKDHNVILVIKQHGGDTGTGQACAAITQEVNHPNIKVNYDAGNVLDYLEKDPIADIQTCVSEIRSFCIKDHRLWPKKEDCGPGFGEIDHYRLLLPVAFTGLTIPLACENIFVPLLPRPEKAEDIDKLARHAREYLEWVVQGLQVSAPMPKPSEK